ncbi:MAG: hypothetical protein ACM3US_08145 [Sphingomonadaceae bacterium]
MRRIDAGTLFGILLVLSGLFLLLQTLGILSIAGSIIWAVLFLAGGLAFLGVFMERPSQWWALIPGLSLLALGALIALESTAPWVARTWGGSLFLGGIGLSFWLIFLVNPRNWWAIIPGGALATLAVVAGMPPGVRGPVSGGVFFFGLGATFALVYLLGRPREHMTWALIPAAILALLGAFTMASAVALFGYVWPTLIILAGLYLILRALQTQRG